MQRMATPLFAMNQCLRRVARNLALTVVALVPVAMLCLVTPAVLAAPKARTGKAEAAGKAEGTGRSASDKAPGEKADAAKPPADKPDDRPAPPAMQTPVGEDALRLGPFTPPPKPFPFPLLGDDKAREVFVDRAGQLYKDRPYSGHVPDWNAAPAGLSGARCKVEPQALAWVGFQNNADGSRVFVQLEKNACGYVYRPDDLHIVIDLPAVAVANPNLKRDILTGAFPTAVEFVRTEEVPGRGTRIVVGLKDRRSYLSAQLGRYVFVDVAR